MCPGFAGSKQTNGTNLNFETELAIAYPGAQSPPSPLNRANFPTQAAFDAAKVLFLSSFRPDGCDPVPVPVVQLMSGGLMPGAAYPNITLEQANECLLYTGGCSWKTTNRIAITPKTNASLLPDGLGVDATVGLRWCDCNVSGVDLATRLGRFTCQNDFVKQCVIDELKY